MGIVKLHFLHGDSAISLSARAGEFEKVESVVPTALMHLNFGLLWCLLVLPSSAEATLTLGRNTACLLCTTAL